MVNDCYVLQAVYVNSPFVEFFSHAILVQVESDDENISGDVFPSKSVIDDPFGYIGKEDSSYEI